MAKNSVRAIVAPVIPATVAPVSAVTPKEGEVWENIILSDSITTAVTPQGVNCYEVADVTNFLPDGTGQPDTQYVGYRTALTSEALTWRDVPSFVANFRRCQ
jgi:hypothetical protein